MNAFGRLLLPVGVVTPIETNPDGAPSGTVAVMDMPPGLTLNVADAPPTVTAVALSKLVP